MATTLDSFNARQTLTVGNKEYTAYSLVEAEKNGLKGVSQLPFSMRVLLENLLRYEDGRTVTKADIEAVSDWLDNRGKAEKEIAYRPARVLMQDFTGVPAVVDLAAMRDAMKNLGGDPRKINPLVPVDLVIDHSVIVDEFGSPHALSRNVELEYRAQRRALPVPEVGPARLLELLRRAARHRHLPPGQPGVPVADRVEPPNGSRADRIRLPGHAGRHRLAHHHGQRPGRARLGGRRHRGGGGHAGPADLDADPRGHRLQDDRAPARGRHRDRPRAHRDADAAQEGRGRQVRRVLRPGP